MYRTFTDNKNAEQESISFQKFKGQTLGRTIFLTPIRKKELIVIWMALHIRMNASN